MKPDAKDDLIRWYESNGWVRFETPDGGYGYANPRFGPPPEGEQRRQIIVPVEDLALFEAPRWWVGLLRWRVGLLRWWQKVRERFHGRGAAAAPPRRLRRCRACTAFTWRDDPVCLHCGAPR